MGLLMGRAFNQYYGDVNHLAQEGRFITEVLVTLGRWCVTISSQIAHCPLSRRSTYFAQQNKARCDGIIGSDTPL
jgi:hypothetical protein